MLAKSQPTVLKSVTNNSLSDKCINLFHNYCPAWGQILSQGAKGPIISEYPRNKHTCKLGSQLKEKKIKITSGNLKFDTFFTLGVGQKNGHGLKINSICNTHPVTTHAKFEVNWMKTFSDYTWQPQTKGTGGRRNRQMGDDQHFVPFWFHQWGQK